MANVVSLIREAKFPDFIHLSEIKSCKTLQTLVALLDDSGGKGLYKPYMIPLPESNLIGKQQNVGFLTKIDPESMQHSFMGGCISAKETSCAARTCSPVQVRKNYFATFIVNKERILISGNHFAAKISYKDDTPLQQLEFKGYDVSNLCECKL